MMMEDRFLKRLRKKARKGLRGWPIATIAFYGPNLSQATKVTVGIVPSENAEVEELRDWKADYGDIRADPGIAQEILEFIEKHRVLSVAMTDGVIGCPHQEGAFGLEVMLGHPETVVAKAIHERGHGLGLAQRSCEVGVRVTPLVDGRSGITDVVEVGMTGIEAVKLGDHREFSVPTNQGRIAGYRISNGQSAGLCL